jgi:hypothetical protein
MGMASRGQRRLMLQVPWRAHHSNSMDKGECRQLGQLRPAWSGSAAGFGGRRRAEPSLLDWASDGPTGALLGSASSHGHGAMGAACCQNCHPAQLQLSSSTSAPARAAAEEEDEDQDEDEDEDKDKDEETPLLLLLPPARCVACVPTLNPPAPVRPRKGLHLIGRRSRSRSPWGVCCGQPSYVRLWLSACKPTTLPRLAPSLARFPLSHPIHPILPTRSALCIP